MAERKECLKQVIRVLVEYVEIPVEASRKKCGSSSEKGGGFMKKHENLHEITN